DALALAGRREAIRQARPRVDRIVAIDAEALRTAARLVAGRHRSVIPGVVARLSTRAFAPEHRPRVRSIERADVPARLQLVDDACGPRISDLEAPLQQRRRGTIVLPDDLDGIGQ